MTDERTVRTACQGCHCECGVLVHVRNGKVVKIEGDPEHLMNEGKMCPKGLAYTQLLYHPDRLKYPLKRTGQRGAGTWQRISWDEALDTICAKFKEIMGKHGPLAIGYVAQDGPRPYQTPYFLLLRALGSPNMFGAAHICFMPSLEADVATIGSHVNHERGPDYDNTNCMLVWGANPGDTHPMLARKMLKAQERGARLIVVDPRLTNFASKADLWLQLRPGTDCALALGMLNVIINNKLYDREFVEKWCFGFDELRQRVQEYTPEKVSEITWVPVQQIIEAAEIWSRSKPGCHYHRVALNQIGNSFQACRAVSILTAIVGNIDIEGGNFFSSFPRGYKTDFHLWRRALLQLTPEVKRQQIGAEQYPLFLGPESHTSWAPLPAVVKAILTGKPYPLKAVYGVANLAIAGENARETLEALKKLEFLVLVDFFMNPTIEYADIVLPAATWLEQDDLCDISYTNYFCARQKAIEPVGECKDDKWITIELARRMGVTDEFVSQAKTVEEFLDFRVKDMGLAFADVKGKGCIIQPQKPKKYEERGFHTPTGKVELYSTVAEKLDIAPLPYYEEPYESAISTPGLALEYPLIAVFGRRHIAFYHGANRQIPWLRELHPEPTVEIHPDTARELGIENDDWVWIETPRGKGRIKQKAVVTMRVHPRVISAEPFWWFPEKGGPEYGCWESNVNAITSNDPPYDPAVGSTLLRGGLCKVYKAGKE